MVASISERITIGRATLAGSLGALGLVLAGCTPASIDATQLSGLQAILTAPGVMQVGAQGGTAQIGYYIEGGRALIDQARQSGVSEADISLFLAQTQTRVIANVNGVPIQLSCSGFGLDLSVNCNLPITPQGRDGAQVVGITGQTCKQPEGVCTNPAQAAIRVNIDAQGPRLELQPSLTDGKSMKLLIRAFDQSPNLRSLTVSPCNEPGTNIPVTSDATGMSVAIKLLPGPNCTQVTAVDAMGNKASAQANMPYVFDINLTSTQLTPEGKIGIDGITHNSLFPGLRVNVHHCSVSPDAQGGMSQKIEPQKDGGIHTQLTPLLGPNDCIKATATDTQGITIATQANPNIQYSVDLGPLIPMQDSRNPKVWYLATTSSQLPPNLNPDSFVMRGTQKLWPFRPFTVSADFTCEKLPDGTVVNGQTFSLVAECITINETGQAEVQYQIGDKSNGYFSPIQSISLDIPTSPPLADQALFYGFLMGSIIAAAALGRNIHSKYTQNNVHNQVGTMLETANYERARAAVSKARIPKARKRQELLGIRRHELCHISEQAALLLQKARKPGPPERVNKLLGQANGLYITLIDAMRKQEIPPNDALVTQVVPEFAQTMREIAKRAVPEMAHELSWDASYKRYQESRIDFNSLLRNLFIDRRYTPIREYLNKSNRGEAHRLYEIALMNYISSRPLEARGCFFNRRHPEQPTEFEKLLGAYGYPLAHSIVLKWMKPGVEDALIRHAPSQYVREIMRRQSNEFYS